MSLDSRSHAGERRSGLFRRVASRPYRVDRNEREDRLTEILAAVLEHSECASLAAHLTQGWVSAVAAGNDPLLRELGLALISQRPDLETPARVETQLRVETSGHGPRRIDLALFFQNEARPLTIYVEAKIDAAPERDQLLAYLEHLESRPGPGLVILAAPRSRYGSFNRDQMPKDVAWIPWETTAEILRKYTEDTLDGDAAKLLVGELLAYMEEENLVDPQRLEADHIKSLVLYTDAYRGLERVRDIADDYLHRKWGPRLRERDGDTATQLWRDYPVQPQPDSNRTSVEPDWLTWNIFWDAGRWLSGRRHGVPIVAVGGSRRAWMTEGTDRFLADRDFRFFSPEDGTWLGGGRETRIYRCAELGDDQLGLLGHDTIHGQGEALGEWIRQGFEALSTALASVPITDIRDT